MCQCVVKGICLLTELTDGDGGDLCVHVQHPVAIHVHQVVPPALLIVAEEMNRSNILQTRRQAELNVAIKVICDSSAYLCLEATI